MYIRPASLFQTPLDREVAELVGKQAVRAAGRGETDIMVVPKQEEDKQNFGKDFTKVSQHISWHRKEGKE